MDPVHEAKVEELKSKLKELTKLGTPKMEGEIVIATDSSEHQGGAALFQWQRVSKEIISQVRKNPDEPQTSGIRQDGTLEHNYNDDWHLVPLGHYSWKWNPTRENITSMKKSCSPESLQLGRISEFWDHCP